MSDETNGAGITPEQAAALSDVELKRLYDISLKIANDWHEPNKRLQEKIRADNDVLRKEMSRRGLLKGHRPR